jgi:tetratricopeptide (TPR) repeat protein
VDASRPVAPRLAFWKLAGTVAAVGCLLIGGLVAWMAGVRWPHTRGPAGNDGAAPAFTSPYRNIAAGVKYVADDACADCHDSQTKSYHHHPMGRSLAPVASAAVVERFDQSAHNPFESLGFQFAIERRGTEMVHKAIRRDAQGRAVAELDTPVAFAVGSGVRGRSYLINRNGYLFQSPSSWFTQQQAWDLSPVFASFYPPERVVEVSCLFCHANQVEPVPQTRNHYRTPLFRGHAIGCERCHGPGELHVQARSRGDTLEDADDTIVNPRRLSPVLREAVCQQCHLQGEQRFPRQGRQAFDYRPGLPLHEFLAVFVRAPEFAAGQRAVGQVEQMYQSRCFRASKGQLGCVSCHDPHVLPMAQERAAHYRRSCLACHQEQSCALTPAERRKQDRDDGCIACHMPRLATADIAHTAITDHRILRRPQEAGPGSPAPRSPQAGEIPIVNFYQQELDAHDPGLTRDLGMALSHLTRKPGPLRQQVSPVAVSLLEKALAASPEDEEAREALGWALAVQGRTAEALAAYETILAALPQRELTLTLAATLAEHQNKPDKAVAYLRRAIDVNPWIWDYRYNLAKLLAQAHDWPAALSESEKALPLNPGSEPTRVLLITCYLRTGQKNRAESELQTLIALNPSEEKAIRSWFAEQSRQR